jgi:hypothetical protein
MVHLDVKPDNVMLQERGKRGDAVKVVDFGIAHVEGTDATRLTLTGALLGTPAYMAPEQLIGATVDGRTDIYAAGVVLAEMLSGRHPLQAGGGDALPAPVAAIVSRCLQPSPTARYGSARELVRALEGAAGTTAAPASAVWWWQFHQCVVAVVYGVLVVPAWSARVAIGGAAGRTVFVLVLAATIVAAILRLHLWFTSRHYPGELADQRARLGRWLAVADWVFALTLMAAALLIGDRSPPLAILLFSFGMGAALAFLVIAPTTARAAFRKSG